MLRTLKCFLFTSLLRGFVIYSQDQSGFISIDCGRLDRASYNNTRTSITYVSDATFIDSGESKSISPEYSDVNYEQHQYLRSFPQGKRNCYKINNITKGKKYLIRATFVYGNYDGLNRKPEFDLYLGANLWDSVALKGTIGNFSLDKEIVHVPLRNYLHVCVVNTSRGTPFISTIELRPLNLSYYETPTGSLALYYRWDTGPKYLTIYR
nr:putative leucine-rich repeat receptor-like protein kinase At2g19210 [Ziziphus jujuba var. spinosa]